MNGNYSPKMVNSYSLIDADPGKARVSAQGGESRFSPLRIPHREKKTNFVAF